MVRRRSEGLGALQGGLWWWVALGLVIGGLALGFIGFEQLDDDNYEWFDNLYRALQLLWLEDPTVGTEDLDDNEWLIAGRWIAPIGFALAAIGALLLILWSEWEGFRARRQRGHFVVAGLGLYGSHAAKELRAERRRVVGIDLDAKAAELPTLRDAGVRIVTGDAQTRRTLSRAATRKARSVIVTCGDDMTNVEVGMQAALLVEGRRDRLKAFVHLNDLALWRELRVRAAGPSVTRSCWIEYFNCLETGARKLSLRHPPSASAEGREPRVLLMGIAGVGAHLLVHLARWWDGERAAADERLQVKVVGPGAAGQVVELSTMYPRLSELAQLEVRDGPLDLPDPQERELLAGGDMDIVYVCGETDSEGVGAVMALHGAARAGRVKVVLVLERADRSIARALDGEGSLPGVEVFGLLTHALAPVLAEESTNEDLAKAAHDNYVAAERAKGVTQAENPSVTTWELLPDSLKESNLAFARRIESKLEQLECWLVPDPLAAHPAGFFTTDEVEQLAESEHTEWCAELRRSGWHKGATKDAERKIHHLIVPWDSLPEEERDKDRAAVDALPTLVARAGFRIVRKPQAVNALPPEVRRASVDA